MLKMPVIGVLLQKNAIARFTRTLGTLVSSGVPILDGLEVVAKSAGNVVIESAVMYTRMRVAEGKNIAGPLDETKIFPKMVVQMIGVGEATGAMDVMLTKIADFYDDEVDAAVDGLTALIEPLVMIVIGGMVGFVLMSLYLPIFGMADDNNCGPSWTGSAGTGFTLGPIASACSSMLGASEYQIYSSTQSGATASINFTGDGSSVVEIGFKVYTFK